MNTCPAGGGHQYETLDDWEGGRVQYCRQCGASTENGLHDDQSMVDLGGGMIVPLSELLDEDW